MAPSLTRSPTHGKPEKTPPKVRDLRRLRHYSIRTDALLSRVDRAFAPAKLSLSANPRIGSQEQNLETRDRFDENASFTSGDEGPSRLLVR